MQNVNRDPPYTPGGHLRSTRTVKIDRVSAGQIPAVIINDIQLARRFDHKLGSHRPPGPVSRRASDLARLQRGSRCVGVRVLDMITLMIIVRGRSDLHILAPCQRSLVGWELTLCAAAKEEK